MTCESDLDVRVQLLAIIIIVINAYDAMGE